MEPGCEEYCEREVEWQGRPGVPATARRAAVPDQQEAEMVLLHAGGYELLVPLAMLLGLLFIMRGGDPKRDGTPPVETGHRRGRADPENS
jgi:hypothetical protein